MILYKNIHALVCNVNAMPGVNEEVFCILTNQKQI